MQRHRAVIPAIARLSCITYTDSPEPDGMKQAMRLFEKKHMSATASPSSITSSARRQIKLAGSYRADSRKVNIRVDGSEYGAQCYQHYKNDRPDKHCVVLVATTEFYSSLGLTAHTVPSIETIREPPLMML